MTSNTTSQSDIAVQPGDTACALGPLHEQLRDAAQAFAAEQGIAALLNRFAHDVERAMAEPLEIFPVCHHSAASALHMARRLRERPPRVVYIELCADMQPVLEYLRDCTLPVALQAFAAESDRVPTELLPISVVAPISEASAEYQAIAYVLANPDTQLVCVDRPVDFVVQWDAHGPQPSHTPADDLVDDAERLHGEAIGVAIGELAPTFDAFLEFLLRNSNTRHFTEWWDQYVERVALYGDYTTYRETLFLVGSLIRHLGRRASDQHEDRLRERYMWTRIKQHLAAHQIPAHDAIFLCGAAHAASDVPEFGLASSAMWQEPAPSATHWLFGVIPSSFAAIDHQFGHPAGTTGLADAALHKAARASGVATFHLAKPDSGKPSKRRVTSHGVRIHSVLAARPSDDAADHEQLLVWSAQIVALARKNGYLASTADSIAIFQTTLLLAQLRNRPRPSSYDFQDAAMTCLEKERTPRKRTIAQICQLMLGGDRVGTVGYSSLPPLVQELFDRLAPLHLNLMARTNQRALMDFRQHPELRVCSDALWKLHYVLGNQVAEPIVGERTLGQVALQESWDVRLGREQRAIIQLGYEGITIEQVLEQRMKQAAFGDDATAAQALRLAEDALLFMGRPRLVRELGEQATHLLANESGAQDAPDIFERARRLAHFFRSQPDGLPAWLQTFVATGYAHYATLLPRAFGDQGSSPEQIAGMLGFIFTLENFALALGLQRQQIALAIQQASQSHVPAEKLGLLWTAEWLVQQRELASISDYCAALLGDALRLPALPAFLHGFVLSLTFAPGIAPVVVELFSRVFGCLPDTQLLPLLPGLIIQLRRSPQIVRALAESAAGLFPANLAQLAAWQAPWEVPQAADPVECPVVAPVSATMAATRELILAAPAASQALAALLQGLPKP